MTTVKYKVESGIQLLARLTRKTDVKNFYPVLFENKLKYGDIIELFSNAGMGYILSDIISDAIIPKKLGGIEAGVLIFNTDGNLDFRIIKNQLEKKLEQCCTSKYSEHAAEEINNYVDEALKNLYVVQLYDVTQFYATIHNLENILVEHSNISLIIFDTLTAFYWSEQGFKITKMDSYIKNLLQLIQINTKEYKILILYTRPEYFSSTKDIIENLESVCEQLNYRIQLFSNDNGPYQLNIKTNNKFYKRLFNIFEGKVIWLH